MFINNTMLINTLIGFSLLVATPSQASSYANDEQLLKSLIQRGVICSELSYEEKQQALRIYLNRKSKAQNKNNTTSENTATDCLKGKPKQSAE